MSASGGAAGSDGWLAGVVPSAARRFSVHDSTLAARLADAGAELVDDRADVEIAVGGALRGDAPIALVALEPTLPEGNAFVLRFVQRVASSARTQLRVARARRALRARGYPTTVVVRWDVEQVVRRTRARDMHRRLRPAERLPSAAVVVGSRVPAAPTILDEAAAVAARSVGERAGEFDWPVVRGSGVIVAVGERYVLKVAVGPARREVERHCAALDLVAAAGPAACVAERAPHIVGRGRAGLGYWSLEGRLAGAAPHVLDERLRSECLDFLVALHATAGAEGTKQIVAADAAVVAAHCRPRHADALAALAVELDATLEGVPRGFGHGDFWLGNLVAHEGRLTGVVDWSAAGAGRLPLLDLLNLVTAEHEPRYFGRTVVELLLPRARAGGDPLTRIYCERAGVALDVERLEALAVAYWLDRAARELQTYADRAQRPVWLRENVELVVRALFRGTRPFRAASAPSA